MKGWGERILKRAHSLNELYLSQLRYLAASSEFVKLLYAYAHAAV